MTGLARGPSVPAALEALVLVTRQQGVTLKVTGADQLCYQAPAGALTPALKQQLAAHKTELVAYLKQAETGPGSSGEERSSSRNEPRAPKTTDPPVTAPLPPKAAQGPAGAPEAIRWAVAAARDWEDLEPILDAVEAACAAGGLDRAQAENLARLAARVSRAIPPRIDGIKAEELLPDSSEEGTVG